MVPETITGIHGEVVLLDRSPHRAVEHQDALVQQFIEKLATIVLIHVVPGQREQPPPASDSRPAPRARFSISERTVPLYRAFRYFRGFSYYKACGPRQSRT
jgi:hypothetical protein